MRGLILNFRWQAVSLVFLFLGLYLALDGTSRQQELHAGTGPMPRLIGNADTWRTGGTVWAFDDPVQRVTCYKTVAQDAGIACIPWRTP